jgi:hypothetical protein
MDTELFHANVEPPPDIGTSKKILPADESRMPAKSMNFIFASMDPCTGLSGTMI